MKKSNVYTIARAGKDKRVVKVKVEAEEICYDVLGIRKDPDVRGQVVLDHIPTGLRVAAFKSTAIARQAVRELIQETNFQWKKVPKAIAPKVVAILKRHAA